MNLHIIQTPKKPVDDNLKKDEFLKDQFFDNLEKEKPLLTIGEVASLFRMSKKTVYGWIYRGLLKTIKVGPQAICIEAKVLKQWISQFNGGIH